MNDFLRLAAYTFLALMGISAWNTYSGGWRYYLGIVFFVVCVLRILMILRQRGRARTKPDSIDAEALQKRDDTNGTHYPPPPGQ
jgi:TRAP-type C4-dicarboxylate transport system permease small subunit